MTGKYPELDDAAYANVRDNLALDLLAGRVRPGRDGLTGHILENGNVGVAQARAFADRFLADVNQAVDRRRAGRQYPR